MLALKCKIDSVAAELVIEKPSLGERVGLWVMRKTASLFGLPFPLRRVVCVDPDRVSLSVGILKIRSLYDEDCLIEVDGRELTEVTSLTVSRDWDNGGLWKASFEVVVDPRAYPAADGVRRSTALL